MTSNAVNLPQSHDCNQCAMHCNEECVIEYLSKYILSSIRLELVYKKVRGILSQACGNVVNCLRTTGKLPNFQKYYGTDVCYLQVMSGSHSMVQHTRTTVS